MPLLVYGRSFLGVLWPMAALAALPLCMLLRDPSDEHPAPPPMHVPPHFFDQFSMDGRVRIIDEGADGVRSPFWRDERSHAGGAQNYDAVSVERMVESARNGDLWYYGDTDEMLYAALATYRWEIAGRHALVVGSESPWYEAIALAHGAAACTSVNYRRAAFDHALITRLTIAELFTSAAQYDFAISISTYEHDGLGRYGDPVDPMADVNAINRLKEVLLPGALLFLAVPVGVDALVWNMHRIYGKARLPLLLERWSFAGSWGLLPTDLDLDYEDGAGDREKALKRPKQPVLVVRNELPADSTRFDVARLVRCRDPPARPPSAG